MQLRHSYVIFWKSSENLASGVGGVSLMTADSTLSIAEAWSPCCLTSILCWISLLGIGESVDREPILDGGEAASEHVVFGTNMDVTNNHTSQLWRQS